jgi:hypothetical protein
MEAAEQAGSPIPSPNSRAEIVTLRQLSPELQCGWIERLFSRLEALYGASFGRQWDGTNVAEVKSVWAEKLGGFNAQQIGEALKACDERPYPPNLPEFIELCRQAAKRGSVPLTIEAPQLSAEELVERARKLEATATKPSAYDYRGWCKELKRRYLAGDDLSPMQISMASEAMNEAWEKRECRPRNELAA